jgi:hypothetical protein
MDGKPTTKKVKRGNSMTKTVVGSAVIGVPAVNELTNQGIITSLHLEQFVWWGMTYGAWFKLGMGVALLLLVVERGLSIWQTLRNK